MYWINKISKDEIMNYINTGEIVDNYLLTDFLLCINQSGDDYGFLFVGTIILVSDKINLEIQDDELIYNLMIYILQNKDDISFLFELIRKKLSPTKKISIINRFYQDISNGVIFDDRNSVIYMTEVVNLLSDTN